MSNEFTKYDRDVYVKAIELLQLLLSTMEKQLPKVETSVRDHLKTKPNCYECIHRCPVPGDAHSSCAATFSKVTGDTHGINSGWFFHPYNFDPTWLISCDSFKQK